MVLLTRGRVIVRVLRRIHLKVRPRLDEIGIGLCQRPERRDRLLGRRVVAGIGDHAEDHELAVHLLGQERHRRRRHHIGDGRELVGRRLRRRDEAGDRFGRRGQADHAAGELRQVVQPVLEAHRHAEIAAAAADRPEQVGLVRRVDGEQAPVGRDDFRRQQRIDGQPVAPRQVADPAAQRDAADAHGARIAEADHEVLRGRRPGQLLRRNAGFGPHGFLGRVDLDRLHVAQIDDDAAVARRVPGARVPAAAHGQFQPRLRRNLQNFLDILGGFHPHNDPRMEVEPPIHHRPRGIVAGIRPSDSPTAKPRIQGRNSIIDPHNRPLHARRYKHDERPCQESTAPHQTP